MAPRKIAAGNWKMNGTGGSLSEIDTLLADHPDPGVDILICPPATLIADMARKAGGTPLAVGGQDCHAAPSGAHTGDLSAPMLADAGARHVILGHSERRAAHAETDQIVAGKCRAAHGAGLTAIVCIGETLQDREEGRTLDIVLGQLGASLPDDAMASNTVVAYEPVWAIGTGRVATTDQIAEVHGALRDALAARFADGDEFSLLYGGSVKAGNAAEIFAVPHVNGALVGGASLTAEGFGPIITALAAA